MYKVHYLNKDCNMVYNTETEEVFPIRKLKNEVKIYGEKVKIGTQRKNGLIKRLNKMLYNSSKGDILDAFIYNYIFTEEERNSCLNSLRNLDYNKLLFESESFEEVEKFQMNFK